MATPDGPATTTGRHRSLGPAEWRFLWQFRRDVLGDRRARLRASLAPITGPAEDVRAPAIAALRDALVSDGPLSIRMAAAVALGRASDWVPLLEASVDAPPAVREACLLGVGLVQPLAAHEERRIAGALQAGAAVNDSATPYAWISLGARGARGDKARTFATRWIARPDPDQARLAEVLFAARLVGPELIRPELHAAAKRAEFWGRRLDALERAYATLALAGFGTRSDLKVLGQVASSRRANAHTRRAAAFALLSLAEERWPDREAKTLQTALLHLLQRSRDGVVRAFAAFGLGQLGANQGVIALMEAFDDNREDRTLKPVLALSLAAAARRRPEWKKLKTFLYTRARDTKDPETRLALETSVGIARVEKGAHLLLDSLRDKHATPERRAWAADALGALGVRDAKIVRALRAAELTESTAIARALLGDRTIVKRLRDAMAADPAARARHAYTLGTIGGSEAVSTLRAVLVDPTEKDATRAMAAVGLGLALDERPVDPLTALKARINYLATSRALYEVLQIR